MPRRYRVAGSPIVRWFVNSRRRGSPRLSVVDYRPATTVASPPDLPKLDAIASGMPAGTSAVTPAVAAAGGSAGGSGIPFSPPRQNCSTKEPPMCRGPRRGRRRRRGTRHPAGGCDASGGRDRRDGDAGPRSTGPPALPGPSHQRSVPDPPRRDTRAPRGAGLARPRGRGMRRITGRHAAGAARCAWHGHSPSSCNILLEDLIRMEGIICIGW